MATPAIRAPVGRSPRPNEGKPVKNAPEDVRLVRAMLRANGFEGLAESDRCDAALVKAIGRFQKSIGFDRPDMVVDPDRRTIDALTPLYESARSEVKTIRMRAVRLGTRELLLTESHYERVREEVRKAVKPFVRGMTKRYQNGRETYLHYKDVALMEKGFLDCVAHHLVIKVGNVEPPKRGIYDRAGKAVSTLQTALSNGSIRQIEAAVIRAEKAVDAFEADLFRFLHEFMGAAKKAHGYIQISNAVSFGVLAAVAAPPLAARTGWTTSQAFAVSQTSMAVIGSTANELARRGAGIETSVWDSIGRISIDGTIASASAGVGKLSLSFVDDIATRVAPRVAAGIPGLDNATAVRLVNRYLTGAGKGVLKASANVGINVVGNIAKKGKTPNKDAFAMIVAEQVFAEAIGGMTNKLASFHKTWTAENKVVMRKQLLPSIYSKLSGGTELPDKVRRDIFEEVIKKTSPKAFKAGLIAAVDRAKGDESVGKLTATASRQIVADKEIRKLVEQELKKQIEKSGKRRAGSKAR